MINCQVHGDDRTDQACTDRFRLPLVRDGAGWQGEVRGFDRLAADDEEVRLLTVTQRGGGTGRQRPGCGGPLVLATWWVGGDLAGTRGRQHSRIQPRRSHAGFGGTVRLHQVVGCQ